MADRSLQSRAKRAVLLAAGALSAVVMLVTLGEVFLRYFPPSDNREYLVADATRSGPFVSSRRFGVAYRSWEGLAEGNGDFLAEYLPFDRSDGRPTWAMFGNSFVQMPGMLADTTRARLPDVRVFNLRRNETLIVRLAQIEVLLEHGLRPERLLMVLLPLDVWDVAKQPMSTVGVSAGGALAYEPQMPPAPCDLLVQNSALARTAWFRTGRHVGNLDFRAAQLEQPLPPRLKADLTHLFDELGSLSKHFDVPVTVLFIPSLPQLDGRMSFVFQADMRNLLRDAGLDVCDPRECFLARAEPNSLFLPDKHLSPRGNQILLDALLEHWSHDEALVSRQGGGTQ